MTTIVYDQFDEQEAWVKDQLEQKAEEDGELLTEEQLWEKSSSAIDWDEYWEGFKREVTEFILDKNPVGWWNIARRNVTWRHLGGTSCGQISTWEDFQKFFKNLSDFSCHITVGDDGVVEMSIADHDTTSQTTLVPLKYNRDDMENALDYLEEAIEHAVKIRNGMTASRSVTQLLFQECMKDVFDNMQWSRPPSFSNRPEIILRVIRKFQSESKQLSLSGFEQKFANAKKLFVQEWGEGGFRHVYARVLISRTGKELEIEFSTRAKGDKIKRRVISFARYKAPGEELEIKEIKVA